MSRQNWCVRGLMSSEQGAAWKNAGRSDDDCFILALRVAGRNIT